MFKYVYPGVNIVTFLLFWLTWMYPCRSPMVILMVIDNVYVQVQIILLLHHCSHLLMMIVRLELVVNHLKRNKKEKRNLKESHRGQLVRQCTFCYEQVWWNILHLENFWLLWESFYARSKVLIGCFRFLYSPISMLVVKFICLC